MLTLRGNRRKAAFLLIIAMLFTFIPPGEYNLFASHGATVGTTPAPASLPITVTSVEFYKKHTGVTVTGATLNVSGTNLLGVAVRFDFGDGLTGTGTPNAGNDNETLSIELSASDAAKFTGRIKISSTELQLVSANFPFAEKVDPVMANIEKGDKLTITGGNLDKLGTNTPPLKIEGQYGDGFTWRTIVPEPGGTSGQIQFTPSASSSLGYQNIVFRETNSITVGTDPVPIAIRVQANYTSAFQTVKNLTLPNLTMFPNAASPGDTISIASTAFPASAGYRVYFLGPDETYSSTNKAPSVVLSTDLKKLTVTVPACLDDKGLNKWGSKTVVVVDTKQVDGKEVIVAEARVPGTFTLVDGSKKPQIKEISPTSGTDGGGTDVSIKGIRLVIPQLPDLKTTAVGGIAITTATVTSSELMQVNYQLSGLTYQGEPVTAAYRTIRAIIGSTATFQKNADGTPKFIYSTPGPDGESGDDILNVRTASVDDAATDPKKDVVLEITTRIDTQSGKSYEYNQTAMLKDGYTYIPNSIKPEITKVSPGMIHVDNSLHMKENILISIEGKNFLVNKWIDKSNVTHVNYPVVVIQKTQSLGIGDMILMFDKNGSGGQVFYKDAGGNTVPLTDNGQPVPVDMVVLDNNNQVMDGTKDKEVGTRIVLYLPKLAAIDAAASRHVKVLNPMRESDDLGSEVLSMDALNFVKEPAAPIVESVDPNIVTVGGGEEVTITGSTSIETGAKIYIDGKEVTGATRTLGENNKIIIKFKAPPGRLGKTQLAVVNPGGGIAVRDFYYVQSIGQDPKLLTVAPDKGTAGTLLVLGGDNFFPPNPLVSSSAGMDAYTLLGTRVLIDEKDVSSYYKGSYGEILFKQYISSGVENRILRNVSVQGGWQTQAADYAHSLILKNAAGKFFTLSTLFDGTVQLKGESGIYAFRAGTSESQILADKTGGGKGLSVTVADDGMSLDGQVLTMLTPYVVTGGTVVGDVITGGKITGNHTKVISRNQILVTVPQLEPNGNVLRDVAVENPDTKRSVKEKCFMYYASPYPQPTITTVDPNSGSISGGYLINITGTDFENTATEISRVYIDGILVPLADTKVTGSTLITIRVPAYTRDLSVYLTDRITVPLVVVRSNGATASAPTGFTYISPSKEPKITKVQLDSGTAGGGDVVEIEGTNFNYFEPFKDRDTTPGYQPGDGASFTDVNGNGQWDDLAGLSGKTPPDPRLGALPFPGDKSYLFYKVYYTSPVLPKVYFGTTQAKVVSYTNGKLTVVTPPGDGAVDVFVVNNDSGISNKLRYTYKSSAPKINYINPAQGARVGQENRDIYGSAFEENKAPGYCGDDDTKPAAQMTRIEGLIRFADISNRDVSLGQANHGKIGGGGQTIVNLEGGLSMAYDGDSHKITVNLVENSKTYSRVFTGFTDEYMNRKVLIPAGMLRELKSDGTYGAYYIPSGFTASTGYNANTHYEVFAVQVDTVSGRFLVERGYAPRVDFDTATHLNLDTPSYYTIGTVNATVFNPDGGFAVTKYTYRNPASKPTIRMIKPQTLMEGGGAYMVEASVKGGITIEIKGFDFREGVKVYIDKKPMEVIDITTDTTSVPGETLEVIIARVPAGTTADIGLKFPILVENPDGAIASSVDPKTLSEPDLSKRLPIYFIYRNPLSDPVITTVTPSETSVFGGHEILITGSDFRADATVIIGSKGGIPVKPTFIDPRGTWIKFTTPLQGLTVGAKDLQVVNADFGTGIKANGIKIISYPIVDNVKTEDGSSAVEWVSTEGGTKIRINGTGFAEGARVIFGGTRAVQATSTSTSGITGLWKDNKYYTITDGILASAVQFVDSTALVVTMPSVVNDQDYTITVINADNGISDGDDTIKYSLPVPSAPMNLKADVVEGRYIRIYGYTSSNFNYYEIYGYIGNREDTTLKKDNYKEFQLLGTTTSEPYRITRINGLNMIESDQKLKLVIKAVNKYGPSDWSNIAILTSSKLDDVARTLGSEDSDGALVVPDWETHSIVKQDQMAITTLSDVLTPGVLSLDLTKPEYSAVKQYVVNVPESVVRFKSAHVRINSPGAALAFNTTTLDTNEFYNISVNDKMETYANVRLDEKNTQYSGQMINRIPRTTKSISPVYRIDTTISNNAQKLPMTQLNNSMELTLKYNPALAKGTGNFQIFWYNPGAAQWQSVQSYTNEAAKTVSAMVLKGGEYVVLGQRQ